MRRIRSEQLKDLKARGGAEAAQRRWPKPARSSSARPRRSGDLTRLTGGPPKAGDKIWREGDEVVKA